MSTNRGGAHSPNYDRNGIGQQVAPSFAETQPTSPGWADISDGRLMSTGSWQLNASVRDIVRKLHRPCRKTCNSVFLNGRVRPSATSRAGKPFCQTPELIDDPRYVEYEKQDEAYDIP